MGKKSNLTKVYELLNNIIETEENKEIIENIKEKLEENNMILALDGMKKLKEMGYKTRDEEKEKTEETDEIEEIETSEYPENLSNDETERRYIGIMLNGLKAISTYYFTFDDCFFVNDDLLNIYKTILFTDADKYAPEIAKDKFHFPEKSIESDLLKENLKDQFKSQKDEIESAFMDLKKMFTLRKMYTATPVRKTQKEISEILDYELYDEMSVEEVESAIEQIITTEKFKRAILNENITDFLVQGNNTLTNGLELPFSILSSVFKGIRIGETMAYAMPSNAGKSRFTINLAAYVALVHKKKVLVISNEMSEEKMKLCLITTILNNPKIQELHGQKLCKTEGELLEFKYRPDEGKDVEVDKDGFVLQWDDESHSDFVKRLLKVSKEFKMTTIVTDWFNSQVGNLMYFINITDHTNDELKKVIMNYYYKEKVEYVFYDTLKTDIENIGISYEIKKTATILSNLAQNFGMFIASTIQLAETNTDPINLTINDLAVSRNSKRSFRYTMFNQADT